MGWFEKYIGTLWSQILLEKGQIILLFSYPSRTCSEGTYQITSTARYQQPRYFQGTWSILYTIYVSYFTICFSLFPQMRLSLSLYIYIFIHIHVIYHISTMMPHTYIIIIHYIHIYIYIINIFTLYLVISVYIPSSVGSPVASSLAVRAPPWRPPTSSTSACAAWARTAPCRTLGWTRWRPRRRWRGGDGKM